MRPATILHLADVHLGIGSGGAGLEESAFERAVDYAIEEDVDAVLVAGDLFDHARVSDDLLAWTAKQLDRAERPVVLLVGNHDPLDDVSVHQRFRSSERCARVMILDDPAGSMVEVPATDVVVWGRAMVEHERGFRPLEGVPAKPTGRWGVVACHGLALEAGRSTHHASPITAAELAALDWDYVALGHHHGHKVVRESPCPVVYPGATALRRGEGLARAVLVDLRVGAGATFQPLSLALQSD
ncbi:MAG: exonuclease SbcCD subunit D [Acidimicrobiia bacterium]